jgi:hypothetical protein
MLRYHYHIPFKSFFMIIIFVFAVSFMLCPICCGESDSQGGNTALIRSTYWGQADCVRLLIDAGTDKEVRDQVRRRSPFCCGVSSFIFLDRCIIKVPVFILSFISLFLNILRSHSKVDYVFSSLCFFQLFHFRFPSLLTLASQPPNIFFLFHCIFVV